MQRGFIIFWNKERKLRRKLCRPKDCHLRSRFAWYRLLAPPSLNRRLFFNLLDVKSHEKLERDSDRTLPERHKTPTYLNPRWNSSSLHQSSPFLTASGYFAYNRETKVDSFTEKNQSLSSKWKNNFQDCSEYQKAKRREAILIRSKLNFYWIKPNHKHKNLKNRLIWFKNHYKNPSKRKLQSPSEKEIDHLIEIFTAKTKHQKSHLLFHEGSKRENREEERKYIPKCIWP